MESSRRRRQREYREALDSDARQNQQIKARRPSQQQQQQQQSPPQQKQQFQQPTSFPPIFPMPPVNNMAPPVQPPSDPPLGPASTPREDLIRLNAEIDRVREEGNRSVAAAMRLLGRESESMNALRERLRLMENEVVEARSERAALDRRLTQASNSIPGVEVLQQLQSQVNTGNEVQSRSAQKLQEAESVIRQLSAGISSLKADLAVVSNVSNERISTMESALEVERKRQGELARQEIQDAGRVDSIRALIEQRVDIVAGELEALRGAQKEHDIARRTLGDEVMQSRAELRQAIHEETGALRQQLQTQIQGMVSDATATAVAGMKRAPAPGPPGMGSPRLPEAVAGGNTADEWRTAIEDGEIATVVKGLVDRLDRVEGELKSEREQRRVAVEEANAETAKRMQAERRATEAETAAATAAIQGTKDETMAIVKDLVRRVERNDQMMAAVEKEWGSATTEGLRSLHASQEQIRQDSESRITELEQVLSAEIAARRGTSKRLTESVSSLNNAERQATQATTKHVDDAVRDLTDRLKTLEVKVARTADSIEPLAAATVRPLLAQVSDLRKDLDKEIEVGLERKQEAEQRAALRDTRTSSEINKLSQAVMALRQADSEYGERLDYMGTTIRSEIASAVAETTSGAARRCDEVENFVRELDSSLRLRMNEMTGALATQRRETAATVDNAISAHSQQISKDLSSIAGRTELSMQRSDEVETQIRRATTDLLSKIADASSSAAAAASAAERAAGERADLVAKGLHDEINALSVSLNDASVRLQERLSASEAAQHQAEASRREELEGLRRETKGAIDAASSDISRMVEQSASSLSGEIVQEAKALRAVIKASVSSEAADRMQREGELREAIEERMLSVQAKAEGRLVAEVEACRAAAALWIDEESTERYAAHQSLVRRQERMETDADVREAVTITLQNIVSTIADTETKTTFDEMRTEDYRLHTFTHKVQADLKEALQAETSDRKAESDTTNERLTSEVARVESETTAKFDKEISDRQASEKAMNTRLDEAREALSDEVAAEVMDRKDAMSKEQRRLQDAAVVQAAVSGAMDFLLSNVEGAYAMQEAVRAESQTNARFMAMKDSTSKSIEAVNKSIEAVNKSIEDEKDAREEAMGEAEMNRREENYKQEREALEESLRNSAAQSAVEFIVATVEGNDYDASNRSTLVRLGEAEERLQGLLDQQNTRLAGEIKSLDSRTSEQLSTMTPRIEFVAQKEEQVRQLAAASETLSRDVNELKTSLGVERAADLLKTDTELRSTSEKAEALTNSLKRLEGQVKASGEALEAARKDLDEKLAAQKEDQEKGMNDLKASLSVERASDLLKTDTELRSTSDSLKQLEGQVKASGEALEAARKDLDEKIVASKEEAVKQLSESSAGLSKEILELKTSISEERNADKEKSEAEFKALSERAESTATALQALETSSSDQLKQMEGTIEEKLETVRKELEAGGTAEKEQLDALKEKQAALSEASDALQAKVGKLDELSQQTEKLGTEIRDLASKEEAVGAKVSELEKLNDKVQQLEKATGETLKEAIETEKKLFDEKLSALEEKVAKANATQPEPVAPT